MPSRKDKLRESLSAYLDGELSDAEARDLDAALARDPDLAAEMASLRAVRDLLGRLPRASAPAGLAGRVLAQAERERLLSGPDEHAGPPVGGWLGRLAAAAVILLAVAVGVFVVVKLSTPSWLVKVPTPVAVTDGRGSPRPKEIVVVARDGTPEAAEPTVLAKAKGGKGLPGRKSASVAAGVTGGIPVTHFYMNTDNLALAQRDVERVLRSNGIQPVVLKRCEAWYAQPATRGSGYYQSQPRPNRIEYEVPITRRQLRRIIRQLNSIRAEQKVPQVPVAATAGLPSEAPAAHLARVEPKRQLEAAKAEKAAMLAAIEIVEVQNV